MKGMLFKPDMIQAVVEGTKTNTRRIEKALREINETPDTWAVTPTLDPRVFAFVDVAHNRRINVKPRYHAGETVYIKEKALYWDGGAGGCSNIAYQDDPEIPQLLEDNNRLLIARETANILAGEAVVGKWKWRSPLLMPERFARHFITITGVMPERLQGITYEGLLAEGWNPRSSQPFTDRTAGEDARDWFQELWDFINPKHPTESNPWVFPYAFRRAP